MDVYQHQEVYILVPSQTKDVYFWLLPLSGNNDDEYLWGVAEVCYREFRKVQVYDHLGGKDLYRMKLALKKHLNRSRELDL